MNRLFLLLLCSLALSSALAQGKITGQITDENGEPLVGANVVLLETKKGTSTNEKGVYRFEDLAPGTYNVRVSFVGYEREIRKTVVGETAAMNILHVQLTNPITAFETLVISATRAGEKDPFTYTNLDVEELEPNNLGQDVPFQLRWTPSAVVTSDAGTGIGYTGIRIRGTDPTRINVTINGIPLNDSESQGVFWVNLPDFMTSVEDVQIQRGVGTSTNGAGAFGASINLKTNALKKEAHGSVNAGIGSFNSLRTSVEFGSGLLNDRFTLDGRLSRITSDGYIDRASADLRSFFLSGAYIGEKNSLRLNVFSGNEVTYQAWYGVPADLVDDRETRTFNSAGTERAGDPYENEVDNYTQTHYQLLFSQQINRNIDANINLHYTRGFGYFEQYKADEILGDYGLDPVIVDDNRIDTTDLIRRLWLDNDFYGVTYSARYNGNGNRFRMTLGGAWNRYLGDHFGEVIWAEFMSNGELGHRFYQNDAEKRDFNVFAKANYEVTDYLTAYADLQYRSVFYEFLGFNRFGENVTQDVRLHFFNPKAGLFYQLTDQQEVYASFAVGSREPNRDDFTLSSPESRPEPEILYNTEVGWRYNGKKVGLGVNGYHMYYVNQLVLTGEINDVGAYTRINVPESFRMGVELQGGWKPSPAWSIDGNVTVSRNRVRNYTAFIDVYDADFNLQETQAIREYGDTDLAFSPNLIAALEVSWDPLAKRFVESNKSLQFTLANKYVGRQYLDNTSQESSALDPYFFTDLRVNFDWHPSWVKEIGLTFTVRNLWDSLFSANGYAYRYLVEEQMQVDRFLYPQATRNFLAGIRIGF
jgi:iron complex outermembrane receptor protein